MVQQGRKEEGKEEEEKEGRKEGIWVYPIPMYPIPAIILYYRTLKSEVNMSMLQTTPVFLSLLQLLSKQAPTAPVPNDSIVSALKVWAELYIEMLWISGFIAAPSPQVFWESCSVISFRLFQSNLLFVPNN